MKDLSFDPLARRTKTAEQADREMASATAKYNKRLKQERRDNQAKPMTQSLGQLLKQAGVR